MSLQFILGGAGSGKSRRLYDQVIRRSLADPAGRFLIVVPEQFTMQTQRDLVTLHERKGISNIDVLSFLRLSYRVFEELGMPSQLVLEDTGKNMVLRRLLASLEPKLKYFKNTGKKQGFVEELKSLLTELYQYSVTPERLQKLLSEQNFSGKPLLQQKLTDTLLVYQEFQKYKNGDGYIVEEEILDLLCQVIGRSDRIQDSVICLDGFTGFTPSQYKLLRLLMTKAKDMVVTVSIDPREELAKDLEEFRLFHLSKKTIARLTKLAEEEGVPVAKPVYTEWQHENPQLRHLERNLFRYPVVPYEAVKSPSADPDGSGSGENCPADGISLHVCRNPKAEAEFVLTEIAHLVRDEGYRYRDIAVITGDMGTYGELLEEELRQGGIFRFLDQKRDIMKNPLVEFIRASLSVLEQDFSYESVMRYLRSGLSGIPQEEADVFENELLARGIRGKNRYAVSWYPDEQGAAEAGTAEADKPEKTAVEAEADKAEAAGTDVAGEGSAGRESRHQTADRLREYIYEKFLPLLTVCQEQNRSGASMTMALYEFLVSHKVEEQIGELRQEFELSGKLLSAKEYDQVYKLTMELLEKFYELLGDESLTVEEYRMILESGFSEEQVGLIPPGLDQVVVGDLERTRLKDIRALFCLGVNEGIVPKSGSTGGILTDMEREFLGGMELELAPTQKEKKFTEQFYLYLNLTKPKNHLYVSYSHMGMDGKSLRPSYLIGKLEQLFPELSVRQEDRREKELVRELRRDGGMKYLLWGLSEQRERGGSVPERLETMPVLPDAPEYGQNGEAEAGRRMRQWQEWRELFRYYQENRLLYEDFDRLLSGYHSAAGAGKLRKEIAKELYGEVAGSVTRLEQFTSCAFAHFLDYGLRLSERQEYRIGVPDIGSIFHEAIERFSEKVRQAGLTWGKIGEEQRKSFVRESVAEATEEYGNRILHSSKRLEALIDRVERITDRTVWAVCEQVKMGDFEPKEFETRFSFEAMQGRIDRLDAAWGAPPGEFAGADGQSGTAEALGETQTGAAETDVAAEAASGSDAEYIRIVDYKSGGTVFDLNRFYYGLGMQLVVYLRSALEKERQENPGKIIIPAGIFYYHIKDPIVDKGSGEEAVLKELALNGLVHQDISIEAMMDRSLADADGKPVPSAKSLVIPVSFNKDGRHTARSSVATGRQMEYLMEYVEGKVRGAQAEILTGEIGAKPYRLGNKTGCDYCSYRSVCGFDVRIPGFSYRRMAEKEPKEIWEEWEEEHQTGGTAEAGQQESAPLKQVKQDGIKEKGGRENGS